MAKLSIFISQPSQNNQNLFRPSFSSLKNIFTFNQSSNLDEPTNHLDLESVEWLEDFLRNQNIPMVIVSHDREFLDQVCTKIVDTEGGLATEYDGNYSKFLQLKKGKYHKVI